MGVFFPTIRFDITEIDVHQTLTREQAGARAFPALRQEEVTIAVHYQFLGMRKKYGK